MRVGDKPISAKTWFKLEQAEARAGIGASAEPPAEPADKPATRIGAEPPPAEAFQPLEKGEAACFEKFQALELLRKDFQSLESGFQSLESEMRESSNHWKTAESKMDESSNHWKTAEAAFQSLETRVQSLEAKLDRIIAALGVR